MEDFNTIEENEALLPEIPVSEILPKETPEEVEFVPGEVVLKFNSDFSRDEVAELQEKLGAEVKETIDNLGIQLWSISDDIPVEEAVKFLSGDERVEFSEPNYIGSFEANIPSDPDFSNQWGLNNVRQTGGTLDADIDAPEAWDFETGSSNNVVVGVIDSGVDYTHQDLVNNIWINRLELFGDPGVDDDGNTYVDDIYGWDFFNNNNNPLDGLGHGTHVAGIIAAEGDNGIGVTGVSWDASLMALKIGDTAPDSFSAARAIEYATNNGASLTNNSYGMPFSNAILTAIQNAETAGVLFVAAAGNSNNDNDVSPVYPASHTLNNIISVASTDHNDQRSSFSNYGATSVDLGAPGENIYSTLPGDGYGFASGTSMAAPHVAGAAALIMSLDPSLTSNQVKNVILSTVDTIPSLTGITVTDGRLNLGKAAHSVGDPHLLTFDGKDYDFQATGDFILMESEGVDAKDPDDDFAVHVRQEPGFWQNATVNTGTAIKVNGYGVVLYAEPELQNSIIDLNNPSAAPITLQSGESFQLGDDAAVTRTGNKFEISSTWENVSVDYAEIQDYGYFNIKLDRFMGLPVAGLLGNSNGNPNDDIALRDGTVIPPNEQTFDFLHTTFAQSWQVLEDESLFENPIELAAPEQEVTIETLDRELRETAFRIVEESDVKIPEEFVDEVAFDVALTLEGLGFEPGNNDPELEKIAGEIVTNLEGFFDDSVKELSPPIGVRDTATTDEDTSITIDVLANDTDLEKDILTITGVDDTATIGSVTTNGVNVIYNPNGQFDYLNAGESATDTFTYTIDDSNGGTDTAPVTVTVEGVNNRDNRELTDESNDTIKEAICLPKGLGSYLYKGFIGDNPNVAPSDDVDLIKLELNEGARAIIDINAREYGSALDSVLRVFDSAGNEVAFNDDTFVTPDSYRDSFIDFTASVTDTYYIGVSSYHNFEYNIFEEGSDSGYTTGEYDISILVENGSISGTKWNDVNGDGARSTIINTIDNPGGLDPDRVDVQLVSGDDLTFDITVTVPETLDFVLLQDLSGSFRDDVSTLQTLTPNLVSSVLSVDPSTTFGVASFVDKPIPPFGSRSLVPSVLSDTLDTTFEETSFVDQPISPIPPTPPTPPVLPISPVTPVTPILPIPPFGGSSDYVYQTDLALTTDTNLFQTTVDNLVTLSGGDSPESQLEALMQVALRETEVGYRPGSRRVVLLTTDNTYHIAGDGSAAGITTPNNGDNILDGSPAGTGEDYPDINQVRSALTSANIVPIFAVTSDQISTYQNLVDQLGFGVVEELTSNSSNLVNAVTSGLNQAFQDIVMVAQSDDYSYVESITPTSYSNVPQGESRTFTVTLDTDTNPVIPDTITLTALGFGETEVNVGTAPESGLAGVEIYLDLNNNGVLDPDEPSTFTATDDPNTPEDETGYYEFTGLSAGDYVVREVVPSGYVQTSPIGGFHQISLAQNENVIDIDFGNRLDSLTPVISPTIRDLTDGSTIPTLPTVATNNDIPENTDEVVAGITSDIQSNDSLNITDTEQSETINGEISAIQNDEVAFFAPQANQILTNEIANSSTDSLEEELVKTTSEQVEAGITSIEDVVTENTVSLNEQIVTADTSVEEIPAIAADVDETTIEAIDLTAFASDKVTVDYTISREADFDNQIYFYAVDDITGTVDGVAVGEDNYIETALSNLVSPVFSTSDDNTETGSVEFDAGSIILPVIIADGTLNEALSGDAEVYLPFSGANSDNFDHIKLLDNNTFGFEDLLNGGDQDFNDIQITMNSIA
ncbi:MAG: S8 family serine peptidase [Cyanobacteria bacterium J06635_10]